MGLVVSLIVNALAVAVAAYLLTPHVHLDGFMSAVIVAIIMAIINTFVKPIITLLTLPINLLTLGLFSFIINGILILFISGIVDGFQVQNFGWAVIFSIVLSIISSLLGIIVK